MSIREKSGKCQGILFCPVCMNPDSSVKLLTEHHLEFLSFKGGCTGSSTSTLVKIPHFWKSRYSSFYMFYRARFESVVSELIQKCTELIDKVLKEGNVSRDDIDKVSSYSKLPINSFLLVSAAHVQCKQFGSRSSPT